jgi:putative ABC transport system permease protein
MALRPGVGDDPTVTVAMRTRRVVDDLWRDLRLAIRALGTTPVVTSVAMLSLALAIGGNTAIFSILNGLLLNSLPVREPDRLVHVTDSVLRDTGETRVRAWSHPVWEQIKQRGDLFEAATAWSFTRFNLAESGETRFVDGVWADGGFFSTLGIQAIRGRTFSPEDDARGGGPDGPVTIVSYQYWQRRLAGDPNVIGTQVRLNNVSFTIVGITPAEFFGLEVGRSFDFIVPLKCESLVRGRDSVLDSASTNFLSIIARLSREQSLESAVATLRRAQPEIRATTVGPWSKDVTDQYLASPFTLVPAATGYSNLRSNYQRPLVIIAVIVGLVLLIGCVNVANFLLARAIGRGHELSVRLALGASPARLARQLFTESMVLAAAGAGLGILVAGSISQFLVKQLSTPTAVVFLDISLDRRVLAFTAGVTALTALLFGTAPAIRAARVSPIDALKQQNRSSVGERRGLMAWLVIVQVSLSLMLVVTAGLFIRSFASLVTRPLGLDPNHVLVVTIDTQGANIGRVQRLALYENARGAASGVPGVAHAAISHLTPVGGGGFTPPLEIPDASNNEAQRQSQLVPANGDVFGNLVSPGWFETFGIPLRVGRAFAPSDRAGAERVAIVNEAFARRFFADGRVLGRTVILYPGTARALRALVVGLAGDAVYSSPREAIPPTWYLPIAQFDLPEFSFATARLSVRAETSSPERLIQPVVAAVANLNPRLSLTPRLLSSQVHFALTRERLMAQLAGFLSLLALLMAALGLYGMASYSIQRRRTEIALRLALGATRRGILALLMATVSVLVGAGMVAGTVLSLWTLRLARGLLFDLEPSDPLTFAGSLLVLCVVAGVAAWLPARRAVRIDPAGVLRGA